MLDQQKIIEQEPYDRVVRRIANMASFLDDMELDDEGQLRPEFIKLLHERLRLRSKDKVLSHSDVLQRLEERKQKQNEQQ